MAAFNRAVENHAEELMQRAVQNALAGDRDALSGLLALVGHAMSQPTERPAVGAR
jgi:hypothetical protein